MFSQREFESSVYEYIEENALPDVKLPKALIVLSCWNRGTIAPFLGIFKPFINTNDILTFIRCSRQNVYWAFGYLHEAIKSNALNDNNINDLLYQIILGQRHDSESAFKALQSKLMDDGEFDPRAYNDIKERIARYVFGDCANQCFNADFINRLTPEKREEVLKKLSESEAKDDAWIELDKKLKPFGCRASSLRSNDSEIIKDYLLEELKDSEDAKWVSQLARSFDRRSYENTPAVVNEAMYRLRENIRFSEFAKREHVYNIKSPKMIEFMLAECQQDAKRQLADNYGEYFYKKGSIESVNWTFFAAHNEVMSRCAYPIFSMMPIDKWQWIWEQASSKKARQCILDNALHRIRYTFNDDREFADQLKEYFNRWLHSDLSAFDKSGYLHLDIGYSDMEGITSALYMWDVYSPEIKSAYAKELNQYLDDIDSEHPDTQKLLELLCIHDLKKLMKYSESRLEVLAHLSNDSFEQFIENIELIEKSNAAVKYLAKGLANVSCGLIDEKELYTHAKKPIREAAQWSLILSQDEQAPEVIKSLLKNKKAKLTDVHISHYIDKLEIAKQPLDNDPFELGNLAEYCAAKINQINIKKLQRLWRSDIEALWGEQPELLQYGLILLAQNEWGGIPRLTRLCFSKLSPEQRKVVATKVIESWAKGEGHKSDFWVLDLLTEYSDENTIPMLQKLVVDWHKKYRLRAAQVVTALGAMDTTLALNACDEFYKKSKYSWDVREAARDALIVAAKRRGIPLAELYDELVPTFGLSKDGLNLNTGTRDFTVHLQANLDLTVTDNTTGKLYKSLPKTTKDEDPELRVAAESQYKLLKKNIKPTIKSLEDRFTEAFDIGKSWSVARWKRLFLEHPIMSLVGQAFIWELQQSDTKTYFRISEDLSLINADDEDVDFDDGEVLLMHPAETPREVYEAWKSHMADYDIDSFIDQLGANDLAELSIDWESNSLSLFDNTDAQFGKFKRLLAKHNYVIGDSDGSSIFEYYRNYINAPWAVQINMDECRSYYGFDEDVIFGNIHFIKAKKAQKLSHVPKRLISSVVSLIQEIQQ